MIPDSGSIHPNRNRKAVWGWTIYDWANSVFTLTITTAIFPMYFHSIAREIQVSNVVGKGPIVPFAGFEIPSITLLSLSIFLAYLIVVLISPLLAALADYGGHKRKFLLAFCMLGSLSCAGMYFFRADTFYLGFWLYVFAAIGYAGGNVFNDGFLPEIADKKDQDRVSARAYAIGYLGSVFLLALNLAMVMKPELFIDTKDTTSGEIIGFMTRLTFVSVGIWWAGFGLITFFTLKDVPPANKPEKYIRNSYLHLKKTASDVMSNPMIKKFLFAYLFLTMGVQTIMYLASSYGDVELNMNTEQMIILMLAIQIIAIPGSLLFSWSSSKIGNLPTLTIASILWCFATLSASWIETATGFTIVGCFIGLIMGGTQSLARSTFSKMIPETRDTASFFSFYSIVEKVAIILGMGSFALISREIGNRNSMMSLTVFFILAGIILFLLHKANPLKNEEST